MKINFSALSEVDREAEFAKMDNAALTAALTEARGEATPLFALTEASIDQVNEAEALVASIGLIEAEQAKRAAAVKDAADRFAAARQSFSAVNDGVESSDDEADEDEDESDEDDADEDEEDESDEDDADESDESEDSEVEAAAAAPGDKKKQPPFLDKNKKKADDVTTASGVNHTTSQRVKTSTAASKVGRKTKRPVVASKAPVTITAAADVPGFSTSQSLDGMEEVTKALMNRTKGFPSFNLGAAKAVRSQMGATTDDEVAKISKFGVASFGLDFPGALTAAAVGDDYSVVRTAIKQRYDTSGQTDGTLTAAGWCAPSENVYSWIADYVVDGLSPTPEVNAPRGGLNVTTGPARASQGTALDDFGWTQTEAEANAGTVKPFETIVCPAFTDHRLDAIGYAYKIPLLTQKAYPELITDALRFANVLYAHRKNRRVISDKVALSTDITYRGYGASFTDSLEAVAVLATRERRKWNLGENAVMEVEAPLIAREVYRADMSRRTGLALSDIATDQKIAAEFSARHINVTYVADWQELPATGALTLPGSFKIMVYPAGTFVSAVEDVVNLSAIYDAASLSVNEYTGVFFEQGYMLFKAGYGSSLLTIPINTAGETGAAIMTGLGDSTAAGSF